MTKDEALTLALEALEGLKSIPGGRHQLHELNAIHRKHDRAITAIKDSLAAPVQEPVAWISHNFGLYHFKPDESLDPLPLYLALPAAQPAPVQEPVGWLYPEGLEALQSGKCWTAYGTKQDGDCKIPVYLNAAVAPKVEPAKAECGGFDSHPAAPMQEPAATDWERIAKVQNAKLMAMIEEPGAFEKLCEIMDKYEALSPTPPAAQRQWVGLSDDDKLHIEIMGGKSDVMLAEMVEAKLKEKNNG